MKWRKILFQPPYRTLFACALLLLGVFGSKALAAPKDRFIELQDEYDTIRKPLFSDKLWKDDTISDRDIFEKWKHFWDVVGDWTVAYLETTPEATPDDVAQKIEELYALSANVTQLVSGEHAIYVAAVCAQEGSDDLAKNGTFFLITRTGKTAFRVAWNIKEVAGKHYESHDEIGYWAYVGFAYSDGPLIGDVSKLPPNRKGNPRFYIDATAMAFAGGFPKQISLWEWNGHEAIPLLIETYHISTSTPGEVAFDGELLTIPMKKNYKMFWGCGTCEGATIIRTIKVTPDGISDLGQVYAYPEEKLVDDLWDALLHKKNAEHIASPDAINTLRQIIEEIGLEGEDGALGQGGGNDISTPANPYLMCFGADILDSALLFEFEIRNTGLYVSTITVSKQYCNEFRKQIQE